MKSEQTILLLMLAGAALYLFMQKQEEEERQAAINRAAAAAKQEAARTTVLAPENPNAPARGTSAGAVVGGLVAGGVCAVYATAATPACVAAGAWVGDKAQPAVTGAFKGAYNNTIGRLF